MSCDASTTGGYVLPAQPNDRLAYAFNLDQGFGSVDPATLTAAICFTDCDPQVSSLAQVNLKVVTTETGERYVFVDAIIPELAEDCYEICFFADGERFGCSIPFRVYAEACNTLVVRFTNDGNGNGIPYALNPGFTQQLRIGLEVYYGEYEADQTLDFTASGSTRQLHNRTEKLFTFETDYIQDFHHELLGQGMVHEIFEVQDALTGAWVRYVLAGTYQVDWPQEAIPKSDVSKASGKLRLSPYDRFTSIG